MTINKAITILTDFNHRQWRTDLYDVRDAIKLGIEAMNYIIRLRSCSLQHRQAHLPSEDS